MATEPTKAETDNSKSLVSRGVGTALKALKAAVGAAYDGDVGNYLGHGASELANVIVHGHAAPMYSRSTNPVEPSPEEAPEQPQVTIHGAPEQQTSLVVSLASHATTTNASVSNEQSQASVSNPAESTFVRSESKLHHYVEEMSAMSDPPMPENELSR